MSCIKSMLGEKRIVKVKGKYLVKSGTISGVVYQGHKVMRTNIVNWVNFAKEAEM